MTEPIQVPPGTALASLIGEADAAVKRADEHGIDAAYRKAVALADSDELRSSLAVDHIARLSATGGATRALRRCDEYLVTAATEELALRLLRAEALGAIGDHEGAATEAALVRVILGPRPWSLSGHDNARLLRVEGLAAANGGDLIRAKLLLADAHRDFLVVNAQAHAAAINADLSLLAVRHGDREAVAKALADPELRTPADHLRYATALKRALRYEEAHRVLLRALAIADPDPALRVQLLSQLVVLTRLTCQHDMAERLTEMLRDAAVESGDPSVDEMLARLSPGDWLGPVTSSGSATRSRTPAGLSTRVGSTTPSACLTAYARRMMTGTRPPGSSQPENCGWRGTRSQGRRSPSRPPSTTSDGPSTSRRATP